VSRARPPQALIALIDPADPADPELAPLCAAASAVGRLQQCADETAALRDLLPGRDPAEVALVVLGPTLEQPLRRARAIDRSGCAAQLVFVVRRADAAELRRSAAYSGFTLPWAVVFADDPMLAEALAALLRGALQRRRFRSTVDRMNLQLRQPTADTAAYRRLVVSNRYLASILEHSADAIFSLDNDGTVLTWNRGAERMFGIGERAAIGRPFHDIARWSKQVLATRLAAAAAGEVQRFEVDAGLATGSLSIEMTLTPVQDDHGAVMGVAAIVRDISDRRRAEREREQVLTAERAARAEIERVGRIKDEFLAVLSHELKTPLSAVLGYATVLQRVAGEDPTLLKAADAIARNAQAQSRLIEELLDMSAIAAGKLRLERQDIEPSAIVREAVEAVRPLAARRDIELDCEIDAGCVVRADPHRLRQILSNLLTNAVKFSHDGGRVEIAVRCRNAMVEFEVRDYGEGIEPDFLPQVFGRFTQADASNRRRQGGLGLGLSVVRQLVELHEGSVHAHSDGRGRGTRMVVCLPVPASATGRAHPRRDGAAVPDLQGVNVLIIDDEADAREMLQMLLGTLGARPRIAADAQEGLQALRSEPFDLLLSDISMPGCNGYELVRALRASTDPRLRALPAIAVTAFGRNDDRLEALHAGYDAHVPKPVELPALVRAIDQAFGR
jgi:PAS domain S-box-containing protein